MDVQELLSRTQDAISVRRVYGEPYEKDGAMFIPVAVVAGGGGGGGGTGTDAAGATGAGDGMGYGVSARPVGVYASRAVRPGGVPRSTSIASFSGETWLQSPTSTSAGGSKRSDPEADVGSNDPPSVLVEGLVVDDALWPEAGEVQPMGQLEDQLREISPYCGALLKPVTGEPRS